MKKILYILCLIPVLALGQTTAQNYVKTLTYRDSTNTLTPFANVTYLDGLGRPIQQVQGKMSASGKDIITPIEYDGFGRQPKEYLPYASGSSNLDFDGTGTASAIGYYSDPTKVQDTAVNPYSEKFFETSPLSRVMKQGAPGASWKGHTGNNNTDHTVKFAYLANVANEVQKLRVNATWNPTNKVYDISLVNDGYYAAAQLYKTITQDENKTGAVYTGTSLTSKFNTTEEFKDKEGRIVLKRTYYTSTDSYGGSVYGTMNTYYVYDQFGNLTYVFPPKATLTSTATNLNNLCYQYKYDSRNRLVEKKLPGKQWEFIVYDSLDRPILNGPTISPFGGSATGTTQGWLRTIYDAFGRVAVTGWYQSTTTINAAARTTLQTNNASTILTAVRGNSTLDTFTIGYNTLSVPTTFKLLTVNYYDNYTWPGAPTVFTPVESQNIKTKTKGLPTGSWVRVLTTLTGTESELSYTLYDNKSRAIQTKATNYLGGYTQVDTKLDFDGTPLYTYTRHKRLGGDEIVVKDSYTYTAQDRPLTHTHQINNLTAQTLARSTYNELGQLILKNTGSYTITGSQFPGVMQTIDYKYNIRGWLTDINNVDNLGSDLFAFRIAYNTVAQGSQVLPLYNGNISETYWRTGSDAILRKYSYSYDQQNRLLNSKYEKPGAPNPGSYDESAVYDANGNITSLKRYGGLDDDVEKILIDDLTYTYPSASNQLQSVADPSNSPQGFKDVVSPAGTIEYGYDANGNMISDINKGITAITYNHLNLPVQISFGTTNKIVYLYNAAGKKIKKTVTEGINTVNVEYFDGFQYKGGILQFFPTAEGYVENTVNSSGNNVYNYVFQYKDHLGNVRLNYALQGSKANPSNVVIKDENHYYPFGFKHLNYNMEYLVYQEIEGSIVLYPPVNPTGKLANNYKYNGKELQDELGLNMYDYGARNYDPALGRWMNIDPKAETSRRFSPYTYALNNPVYYIDPDGMESMPGEGMSGKPGHTGLSDEDNFNSVKNLKYEPNYNASTVVNNKGVIIDHKDDGDYNIYLNNRGGLIVGKERENVQYTKGRRVTQNDLLPDFILKADYIHDYSRINKEKKAVQDPNAPIKNCPICNSRRCNGASHTSVDKAIDKGVDAAVGPFGIATSGVEAFYTREKFEHFKGKSLFWAFTWGYIEEVKEQYDEYNKKMEDAKKR